MDASRYAALGYQQIVGMVAATPLTVPAGATHARITADTQAVRYTDDGTVPTASVGMPLAIGALLEYSGPIANLKFIQQSATATLNVLYYRVSG